MLSYRLVRRSYLEIALSYFHFAENEDESETDNSVPSKLSVCFSIFWAVASSKQEICIEHLAILLLAVTYTASNDTSSIILILKVLLEKSHKEII